MALEVIRKQKIEGGGEDELKEIGKRHRKKP